MIHICKLHLQPITKKVYLVTIFAILFCVNSLKADHFWIFNNLVFVEDPVGSGIYDLQFEYTTNAVSVM